MSDGAQVRGPAVALLELESISRGLVVADTLLKRAQVRLTLATPVSPGKYLLAFAGGVAEVQEAYAAGIDRAGATLLDKLLLPGPASGLLDALAGTPAPPWEESIGVVETHTAASALLSADAALKAAQVTLNRITLCRGIGGKGYFVLTGPLPDVQAALEAAGAALEPGLLHSTEIIERPHADLFNGPPFDG